MITRDAENQFRFHYEEDDDEVASALKNILATTEVGRDYKRNFNTNETGAADYEKILNAAVAIAGGPMITEDIILHALSLLIDSGEIRPKNLTKTKQLAEPEEDNRPRKDGKMLTAAQIGWGEMTRFAEVASMAEINRRKASDPVFADFIRTNLRREMNVEIGDAVTPVGEPQKKSKATAELLDFVQKYNRTASDALKPRGGYVNIDGQQIPYSQFLELVNAATNARLL
jgi:hypothetical protein